MRHTASGLWPSVFFTWNTLPFLSSSPGIHRVPFRLQLTSLGVPALCFHSTLEFVSATCLGYCITVSPLPQLLLEGMGVFIFVSPAPRTEPGLELALRTCMLSEWPVDQLPCPLLQLVFYLSSWWLKPPRWSILSWSLWNTEMGRFSCLGTRSFCTSTSSVCVPTTSALLS